MDAVTELLESGGYDAVQLREVILTNMAFALIGRFAEGDLEITAILPALERVVQRVTANNEPLAAAVRERRARRLSDPPAGPPGSDRAAGR